MPVTEDTIQFVVRGDGRVTGEAFVSFSSPAESEVRCGVRYHPDDGRTKRKSAILFYVAREGCRTASQGLRSNRSMGFVLLSSAFGFSFSKSGHHVRVFFFVVPETDRKTTCPSMNRWVFLVALWQAGSTLCRWQNSTFVLFSQACMREKGKTSSRSRRSIIFRFTLLLGSSANVKRVGLSPLYFAEM